MSTEQGVKKKLISNFFKFCFSKFERNAYMRLKKKIVKDHLVS